MLLRSNPHIMELKGVEPWGPKCGSSRRFLRSRERGPARTQALGCNLAETYLRKHSSRSDIGWAKRDVEMGEDFYDGDR